MDIGAANGYSAAILSSLVTTVVAIESRQALIDKAVKVLDKQGINNVVYVKEKLTQGCAAEAPFDIIVLNGAVASVPAEILEQLAPNGRLVAVVKETAESVGRATLFTRSEGGHVAKKILFEASLPYLQGFAPVEAFQF